MDLFSQADDETTNYLPRDGIVRFFGTLIPLSTADHYFETLMTKVQWRNDEYHFAGKHIVTDRQIAWFGDRPSVSAKRTVLTWIPELIDIKAIVEHKTGHRFQRCLLNLYHNGDQGLGWHSDGEKTPVASLSLGATRKFVFKHKIDKDKVELMLNHGDLLVMEGDTQDHWQHRIPPMKRVRGARINLTFRQSV